MSPVNETVVLTGATGFLGMEVLARLLEQTEAEVITPVRAGDRKDAGERMDTVLGQLYDDPPAGARERIRALPGDVAAEDFGLSAADRSEVVASAHSVIHCAASIQFELPLEEAREINTAGTKRMLDLAGELKDVRRVIHVSTAYVAGRHEGTFHEDDLDEGQEFRNSYEQSKNEGELAARAADLPLMTARPSIVVGDRHTGWTPAFNVIYWPLQAFARGLLKEVPADPEGIVDIVPIDYVADALVHLLDLPEVPGTVNLVAGQRAASNLQLIETACRVLDRDPPQLNADATMKGEGMTFLPYFAVTTRFDDRRAREALEPAGIEMDDLDDYFPAVIDYALRAKWGKKGMTREAAQRASEEPALEPDASST
ncbi:MAG: SDR family oxidoreductase [Solirubrobacteraceae bacterium]